MGKTQDISLKMSPAVQHVLRELAGGKVAEAKRVGYTQLWFLDGQNLLDNGKSVTRAVNSLHRRGLVEVRVDDTARVSPAGRQFLKRLEERRETRP